MANYRETFRFEIRDVENGLRSELSRYGASESTTADERTQVKQLHQLLAKIYHQQVFYSQVQRTGVPSG